MRSIILMLTVSSFSMVLNVEGTKADTFRVSVKKTDGTIIPAQEADQFSVNALKPGRYTDLSGLNSQSLSVAVENKGKIRIEGYSTTSDAKGGAVLEFSIPSNVVELTGNDGDRTVLLIFNRRGTPGSLFMFVVVSEDNSGHNEMAIAIPRVSAPAPKAVDPPYDCCWGYTPTGGDCCHRSHYYLCRPKKFKHNWRKRCRR
ncbi:MAG: hypothetical protein NXI29_16190 [bacterium]|nr:hypothetical protein [bacterium]